MKSTFFIPALCCVSVLTECTACDPRLRDNCDGNYKTDSVLLNIRLVNSATDFKAYDTIWIISEVSDVFTPLSGSPLSFTSKLEELYLTIQPYQIISNFSTLPYLQYANIEFNPVVKDGSLENINSGGYIFKLRRAAPYNELAVGFVAGRPGTYIVECNHSTYPYQGVSNFQIYNGNNTCTSYFAGSAFPSDEQNLGAWDSLATTNLSLAFNYGSHNILKDSHNYFIIKVIP